MRLDTLRIEEVAECFEVREALCHSPLALCVIAPDLVDSPLLAVIRTHYHSVTHLGTSGCAQLQSRQQAFKRSCRVHRICRATALAN